MKRGREETISVDDLPDLTKSAKTEAIIPLPSNLVPPGMEVKFNTPPLEAVKVTTATKRGREGNTVTITKRTKIEPAKIAIPEPSLVSVKGNSKVDRCIRCNTFVKKGAVHTIDQCNARIAAKKNRTGRSRSKKFRMTDKRRVAIMKGAAFAAAFIALSKPIRTLENWANRSSKRLSETTKKKLNAVFDIAKHGAPEKKVASVLRRFGFTVSK